MRGVKEDGTEIKQSRLIHMEPELWEFYNTIKFPGQSRAEYIRRVLKQHARRKGCQSKLVNWDELSPL